MNIQAKPPQDERRALLDGLLATPRRLPCALLYDATGSDLFEQITTLPEYYLTRTELALLHDHIDDIAALCGPECAVLEYGSGSGLKTQLLLEHLERPAGYVPVEISEAALAASVARLEQMFPDLPIAALCADYTQPLALPEPILASARRVIGFFPGSTLGNFTPTEAARFLDTARQHIGADGMLLIGVDLRKDPALIHAAYNDAQGVTAAFNRNLVAHLASRFDTTIDTAKLHHHATYDPLQGRITMHLIAACDQTWQLGDTTLELEEGDVIVTEYSYKYTLAQLKRVAAQAGLKLEQRWLDAQGYFCVAALTPA